MTGGARETAMDAPEYYPLTGGCLKWERPDVRCGNCGYPSFDAAVWERWMEGECWSCWITRNAAEMEQETLQEWRDNLLGVLDAVVLVREPAARA